MVEMLGLVMTGVTNTITPTYSILCLGDSITHGVNTANPNGEAGGYRLTLYTALTSAGYSVSMVGELSDGPTNAVYHDGHNGVGIGYTSGQEPNDGVSYGVIAATEHQPDFILVMLGTNDMLQPWTSASVRSTMSTRLGQTIDAMHAVSPDSLIVVATIPPIDTAQYTSGQVDTERTGYNTALATVVASRSSWASLVDPASTMTLADIDDQVHPATSGYTKISTAFSTGIQALADASYTTTAPARVNGYVRQLPARGWAGRQHMTGVARARSA